jgi:CheY-like chemotaxis protein/HPt (histidine-containing phosphotransfer) domain-containing protein
VAPQADLVGADVRPLPEETHRRQRLLGPVPERLVAEDNATARRGLEELLVGWRMTPTGVRDAREALAVLRRAAGAGEAFRLALVDAAMPEVDGFTFVERIKEDPVLAGVAIIALVASADGPGTAASRAEAGLAAYLLKPVKQSELFHAVLTALGLAGADCSSSPEGPDRHEPDTPAGLPLHILLAEDNAINQRLAVRLLEGWGHTVEVVANGHEALAALERQAFDVVLMDVQMPEMDGLEATARIRQKEQAGGGHVPVIAMTAHAMKGDRERCLEAGMDGYASKPLRGQELFQAMEAHVPRGAPARSAAPAENPQEQILDREKALAGVGGDAGLLAELARLFRAECPRWLADVRDAVARQDGKQLRRTAHALKGTFITLGARTASEPACQLETIGRTGEWARAEEVSGVLERELERLGPALRALGGETEP